MLNISNVVVMNIEGALRGMRNPMNSWEKSDSSTCKDYMVCSCNKCEKRNNCIEGFVVGVEDLALAKRLCKAGTDHRKFMRQILVSLDIIAPMYWWKEFDTYKVGTVANSTSTMHKITSKEFVIDDFSHDHLLYGSINTLKGIIKDLNRWRDIYINGGQTQVDEKDTSVYIHKPKDKDVWWQLIQLLPSSYNQTRTVTLNYEVLANIYKSRRNHKLSEWHILCDWIETLPLSELITMKVRGTEND